VRLLIVVVVIWLVVGVIAVVQRGYLSSSPASCAHVGTVALTVVAGPLNYTGVNPKVSCNVSVPQPSR
jgi:hypothetical protein